MSGPWGGINGQPPAPVTVPVGPYNQGVRHRPPGSGPWGGINGTGNSSAPPGNQPPPPPPSPTAGLNDTQSSAWAVLDQTLRDYGFVGNDLTALEDFIKGELLNGTNADQISLDLQQTQQFANRFPAIVERRNAGLPPISPAEYVANERAYAQLERAAGIPTGFGDPHHYDNLIASDVSPSEYSARIQQGYVSMVQAPPEARQALQTYYGIDQGHLAAFFTDPDLAWPLLQQKAQAAVIGGIGKASGFGLPSADQAMRLAQLGVTQTQAQTGFADLVRQQQLEGTLVGQSQTALSSDQVLNSEFGSDEQTKLALQRRAQTQEASFQQGGQYGQTNQGITGLGQVVR